MKQLLLCLFLGFSCVQLNGAQAHVAVQPRQQTVFTSMTPSALYPIVGAALMAFGFIPNNKFPTRFRASEELQWTVLFVGCTIFIWYLRKLSNQIGELQGETTEKILLLTRKNEELKKELAELRPAQRPQIQSNPLPTSTRPCHPIPLISPLPHSSPISVGNNSSFSPIDEQKEQ